MKKIINKPGTEVDDELNGLSLLSGSKIHRIENTKIILRNNAPVKKVNIISGGGSGHEPLHSGYVGRGMLDAAVSGEIFTSPTIDDIMEASKKVYGGTGLLYIIKNYTGDVLNFTICEENLKSEGYNVDHVIVNDDVALNDMENRRGVAGTMFVEKIAGAASELNYNLSDVKRVASKTIESTRSMGIAIKPGIIPLNGKPNFTLKEDEMEIGIGIHGEPGIKRDKIRTADKIAGLLFDNINKDLKLGENDEVSVLVNGMGATPLMELFILYRKIYEILKNRNIKIFRSFVGNYVTSLEMAGASLTLMRMDDELKKLMVEPEETLYFPKTIW